MTKGYDSDKDILKILDQATAEAKALRKDAQNGISKKVMEVPWIWLQSIS